MTQIRDLRTALRENLKTIPGVQVSRYALKQPTPPGIHLWPSEVPSYHKTFGTPPVLAEIHFTVEAFVAYTTDIGGQERLDEMLGAEGPMSVALAVESDPTLGGFAQDIECASSGGYGFTVTATNVELLTADWLVTIIL
jgi:hypothetical protein